MRRQISVALGSRPVHGRSLMLAQRCSSILAGVVPMRCLDSQVMRMARGNVLPGKG